jgi:hypothetical protein
MFLTVFSVLNVNVIWCFKVYICTWVGTNSNCSNIHGATIKKMFVCLSLARQPPRWARASSFMRFLDYTKRRTRNGRTLLDEWSARRRNLYLTTHNTHNRQTSITPGGIRTLDLSRWTAVDLRLRPRGHWDRRSVPCNEFKKWSKEKKKRNLCFSQLLHFHCNKQLNEAQPLSYVLAALLKNIQVSWWIPYGLYNNYRLLGEAFCPDQDLNDNLDLENGGKNFHHKVSNYLQISTVSCNGMFESKRSKIQLAKYIRTVKLRLCCMFSSG